MALGKAIIVGAASAIAAPYATREVPPGWTDFLKAGALHVDLHGVQVYWSWPVFCVVTLLVFLLLRAAGGR